MMMAETIFGIVFCGLVFLGIWRLLRDRERHPAAHGLCPDCHSRYTEPHEGRWHCRQCGRVFSLSTGEMADEAESAD